MIKFIYFDVGGVVIDDFSGNEGWKKFRADLGVTPDMDDEFMAAWYPLEHEVLVGRDVETLVPILRKQFGLKIADDYSLLQGFLKHFNKNPHIQPIIDKVEKTNRIGLLTNMYPGMLSAMADKGILPKNNWDVVVDSTVETLKKPDPEIFAFAQEKAGVHGDEILFIDNTETHTDAAKAFGWNVYHYNSFDHEQSCQRLEQFFRDQHFI